MITTRCWEKGRRKKVVVNDISNLSMKRDIANTLRRCALPCATLFLPAIAFAQKLNMPSPSWGTMDDFILTIITIVQTLALGAAILWLIFAGFMFVAARGDETAMSDARKRFLIALVILVVLLGLKVTWVFLQGTYAALGFMAAIFIIIFIFWALK